MSKQIVKKFFNHSDSGTMIPQITIKKCPHCGKLPSYYASAGGFNYYGYYKCDKDNLFATGRHQFPAIGIDWGANEQGEPRLFVTYNGEHNAENGWNDFVKDAEKVGSQK